MALTQDMRSLEQVATDCGVSPEHLLPSLYQSLRQMAHRQLRGERDGHSLNTTALVHEVWLKLVASYPELNFDSERGFLALSGHLMRRVLTDHARTEQRLKRGGGQTVLTYTDGLAAAPTTLPLDDVVAIDSALLRLQQIDARQVQVVELRYFAGFSIEETGELLSLSPATVKREWSMARAWLFSQLQDGR